MVIGGPPLSAHPGDQAGPPPRLTHAMVSVPCATRKASYWSLLASRMRASCSQHIGQKREGHFRRRENGWVARCQGSAKLRKTSLDQEVLQHCGAVHGQGGPPAPIALGPHCYYLQMETEPGTGQGWSEAALHLCTTSPPSHCRMARHRHALPPFLEQSPSHLG